ncbi:glycoside hydrolase family 95 protein [Gramella jeungdoensis]|uniref:Glycoside hydrolase family 95 protein n=1 Tax=Gramella jeungdoensis TaxID=708091 RepID=A0ABT0Z3T9_9FLAO|nr:glycoside hydrolase family 95 protein [Gramella jeungdoensis]MCM8570382.1 glycoside hydrolase family 95 protein [Gramella jeungdoensis]
MKRFIIIISLLINQLNAQVSDKSNSVLWYDEPAEEWMQALPIGNGRFGAMVFGGINKERLQLNEDSLWPGGPDWSDGKGDRENLEEIRRLLKEGKKQLADSLIVENFSYKGIVRSHQTMGDLWIEYNTEEKVSNYKRQLDLTNAITTTRYSVNGYDFSQEVFSSAVDDVMVIRITTENPDGVDFKLSLTRPEDRGHKTVEVRSLGETTLSMKGMVTQFGGKRYSKPFPIKEGVKFETRLEVLNTNGKSKIENGQLVLNGVSSALILVSGNTSFYHDDFVAKNTHIIENAGKLGFKLLKQRHVQDYQKYFDRVQLELGNEDLSSLPTDDRMARIKDGQKDLSLIPLLFQYGRYLLISSSRPGTNAANLQGIWNEHIEAPWNADYHLNVNLQMNYWPAEVTNLSEMHVPLFAFGDRLIERGRKTAFQQYGIERGAVAHQATDLWAPAFMRAERAYWGAWIHGGGWLSQHYWEHYLFTQDRSFLEKEAYPALKAFAEFYMDWLTWNPETQTWISAPETSPENSYTAENGQPAATTYGNAMGHQIIAEVFDNTLLAASVLGIRNKFISKLKKKREKLHPGVVIGDDGRILEWDKPYSEVEKGHRHMSHLYALHPGKTITPDSENEFEAAKKTIAYRLKHGGAGTGWSRAWMININARLLQPEKAAHNIWKFFEISLADNMFDMHPPFQIDGNFGFTAGIAEMLLQSHQKFVHILPCLPKDWKQGEVKGLKARGNIEVSIKWSGGEVIEVQLLSKEDKILKVKYVDEVKNIQLKANEKIKLDNHLNIVSR